MSLNVQEAVEALRPLVRQARATLSLAEQLEPLLSLENHAKELTAQVEDLRVKVKASEAAVAANEAESVRVCAQAKEKAAAVAEDAQAAATLAVQTAQAEADAILADAKVCAKIELDAAAQACAEKVELAAEVQALSEAREALKAEIAGIQGRIAALA